MKITTYDTQTIIDQHKAFLNKYFDQILNKICVILNAHKKNLKKFEQSISNNAKFDNVIHQTEISFEYILRFNYLYSKDILKECYKRQNEHSRYKFAIDLFLTELSNHLKESQNNIDDFVQEKLNDPKKYNKIEMPIYINDFIVGKGKIPKRKIKSDFTYELGKLHGKHPAITIDYFKRNFSTNKKIMVELNNMELNYNNILEYYCSFEYLRKLILKKNTLCCNIDH
jgi:hypothetical protein